MQQLKIVLLALLVIYGVKSNDDDTTTTSQPWDGDASVCTPQVPGQQKPYPKFDATAEFALEIEADVTTPIGVVRGIYREEHLYDSKSNKAIVVTNVDNLVTIRSYDYNKKRIFEYLGAVSCTPSEMVTNATFDGRSPIVNTNGSYQIRTLDDYLLFTHTTHQGTKYGPVYNTTEPITQRGVNAEAWDLCLIDHRNFITMHIRWYLAAPGVQTNFGPVTDNAVPLAADIVSSVLKDGNYVRSHERINVNSYTPGIIESAATLSVPKGVYCKVPQEELVALPDIGISWPHNFAVRVESTSSRSSRWERFHLAYASGRDGNDPFVRYDFLPEGDENYRTVIHDNSRQLKYTIDERRGTCRITRLIEERAVSPISQPIEFFIKYGENLFLYPSPAQAWAIHGVRNCRANGVECIIVTAEVTTFPPIVDSDTGYPTGETWTATDIEYSWGKRSLSAPPAAGATRLFDYPASLYLRSYRTPSGAVPSIANIRIEDVEYEFYDMANDLNPYVFDISNCYRSNNFEYIHLYFKLKADKEGVVDSASFDRRHFLRTLIYHIARSTQVSFIRISELDFDHERGSRTINVFFTLLGQFYVPETSGFNSTEPKASEARTNLQRDIDAGKFAFNFTSDSQILATFTASASSLDLVSAFKSNYIGKDSGYAAGSQALAIIVGLLIGLIVGAAGAFIIHRFRGGASSGGSSVSNPRNSAVSFTNTKPAAEPSKA